LSRTLSCVRSRRRIATKRHKRHITHKKSRQWAHSKMN